MIAAATKACTVCGQPLGRGCTVTCGRSLCQEVGYLRNMAVSARPGSGQRASWEAAARAAESLVGRDLDKVRS